MDIKGRIEFSIPQVGTLPVVNFATIESLVAYFVYSGPGVERQAQAFLSVYRGLEAPERLLDLLQQVYDDNTPHATHGGMHASPWQPLVHVMASDKLCGVSLK